ncbi:hypothetical protein B0T18DRAFT_390893 [Schizothecium vesticola]|uniref:Uncharacterized protein n=1 Tax=Schizothecium vesticola TaxID=314040 RepID=A0AA40K5A3_9PEZI|nr:hypothetical protein B0T18DRAFT_390893 [Schizothecium vesticola]
MTEVTSYPNPHRLGAPSHRLLAPAPVPKTFFFAQDAFYNAMSFQPPASSSYQGLAQQPSMARSPSVSSTSSTASFNAASSRTLSPALSTSESTMTMSASLPRRHSQQLVHRSPYQSHAHSAYPYPSPSQYLQRQPAAQYALYASVPTSQPFPQPQSFIFRQDYLPQQPQATSFESYPALTTSAYQVPAALESPYQQASLLQQRHHQQQQQQQYNAELGARMGSLDPKILENIVQCLGELDVELDGKLIHGYRHIINLSMVNRWFHHHIAQNNFAMVPGEQKHRLVLYAETNYKRYFPRTGGPEGGQGLSDGASQANSLGCYHCFKIKGPAEFELFRYNTTEEAEEPERDRATQSQRSTGLSTTNPHYDPSITRSSIRASSRDASTNRAIIDQSSPRIKETWGIRRFCIDCGVRKQYYRPGALIELRNEKPAKEKKGKQDARDGKDGKEAKWVCDCLFVHKRPEVLQCRDCGMMTPFSQNRGSLLHPAGKPQFGG